MASLCCTCETRGRENEFARCNHPALSGHQSIAPPHGDGNTTMDLVGITASVPPASHHGLIPCQFLCGAVTSASGPKYAGIGAGQGP